MPYDLFRCLVAAILAYCLGNMNGAIIISHTIYHSDVRNYGSKNGGLTNFLRVYGKKTAVQVILIDVFKAVAAVYISGVMLRSLMHLKLAQGLGFIFVIIGHMFPVLYRFHGGKGILSGVSALFVLDWRVALILLGVFILVLLTTRYVSLGSVLCAAIMPILIHFFVGEPVLTLVCTVVGALVIFMHRANISRLLHGTENKFKI